MYTSDELSAMDRTMLFALGSHVGSAFPGVVVDSFATKLRDWPPIELNEPPAYTFEPSTASADTEPFALGSQTTSGGSPADPVSAERRAMRLRGLASIVVNDPPAYTSEPDTASALTCPLALGFQAGSAVPDGPISFAILCRGCPPMFRNSPPAYTSVPDTASEETVPVAPGSHVPSGAPVAVESFAIRPRGWPPTLVNAPPTYTFDPATTSAETVPLASGFRSSTLPSGSTRASRLRV